MQLMTLTILRSMNKELLIVLGVLGILFMLPIIVLVSITDVGALANPDNKLYTGSASTSNTYAYGYCTFWAAERRIQVGKAIPNNWGDAHTWDDLSFAAGYKVDNVPEMYAIMETDDGDLGHVAFVESVASDGKWTISEMNAPGWDIVSGRTFTAEAAKHYKFIH